MARTMTPDAGEDAPMSTGGLPLAGQSRGGWAPELAPDESERPHRRRTAEHELRRYRIERLIGKGHTGLVYEARWLAPHGKSVPVACKVGCEGFRDSPSYRDHVRRAAALGLRHTRHHRNLVTVLEHFEDDTRGWPCLVMELIDGCSVADLHASHRRLPFSVVRRIAMDILSALAFLHAKQVLLFDVSRVNTLVSRSGEVKITALNLVDVLEERQARLRTFGRNVVYASPESLQDAMIDARTDLFCLGAVLYALLTGQRFSRLEDRVQLPADTPAELAILTLGLLYEKPGACTPHRADEAYEILRRIGEPIASRAELGALVIETQRQRRDLDPRDASCGRKSEILEPGHILVRRSVRKRAAPEAERSLRAVLPHQSTKSTLLIRHGKVWRAALLIVLMAACVALGAVLHARVLAPGKPASPQPQPSHVSSLPP